MQRKIRKSKSFAPDPDAPEQICDHPDCELPAGYRAPRGRDNLRSYYWFCLEHVRAYNAKWDYYKGMTPGQIEAHLRADTSWQRPSWKLGTIGGHAKSDCTFDTLHDPLNILRDHITKQQKPVHSRAKMAQNHPPQPLQKPLAILNLEWPTSLDDVKTRYRLLARRYHPDTNPNDAKLEEHFKSINVAYTQIQHYFNHIK